MRRRRLITLALLGALGAVVGGVVAVVAHYVSAPSDVRTSFGWISYAGPRRYADYLPQTPSTNWFALLSTSIGIGLGVGVVLAVGVLMTGRSVMLAREDDQ